MKTFLCVLKGFCVFFFIFSVVILLSVYFDFQILNINAYTIKAIIKMSEPYHPIFIASFSLITLYVASSQLYKYIEVERMRSVVELRELLYQDNNIAVHRLNSLIRGQNREAFGKINKDEIDIPSFLESCDKLGDNEYLKDLLKKCDDVAVDNYLGTLEVAYIMYSKGILNLNAFKSLFGYRIKEIFEDVKCGGKNSNCKLLKDYIEKNKSYYEDLFKGHELIK